MTISDGHTVLLFMYLYDFISIFTLFSFSSPLSNSTFSPERGHGWRYIGEQVSHHPPVSAMYATSLQNTWRWQEEMQVTNGFRGKDLEVYPVGYSHVWFPSSGDHYSWKKVTTCVRNVIFGTMWMDNVRREGRNREEKE